MWIFTARHIKMNSHFYKTCVQVSDYFYITKFFFIIFKWKDPIIEKNYNKSDGNYLKYIWLTLNYLQQKTVKLMGKLFKTRNMLNWSYIFFYYVF